MTRRFSKCKSPATSAACSQSLASIAAVVLLRRLGRGGTRRSIGWNQEPPAPELPPEIVAQIRDKYLEAYRRLVEQELATSS
jgi:hypothetical protein